MQAHQHSTNINITKHKFELLIGWAFCMKYSFVVIFEYSSLHETWVSFFHFQFSPQNFVNLKQQQCSKQRKGFYGIQKGLCETFNVCVSQGRLDLDLCTKIFLSNKTVESFRTILHLSPLKCTQCFGLFVMF